MMVYRFLFPVRGKNVNYLASAQPTSTSPDMLNVRPRDPLLSRIRGGQRPGINTQFSQNLGGPVVAMCMLTRLAPQT